MTRESLAPLLRGVGTSLIFLGAATVSSSFYVEYLARRKRGG